MVMAPPGAQRHGLSAAAQEALAKPIGLRGPAPTAALQQRGWFWRADCRGGGDIVSACRQWSSAHSRQATLVRHLMCSVLVASVARVVVAITLITLGGSQRSALTPTLGSCGVPDAPTARALVTTGCLAPGEVVSLAPAGATAVPVATIAAAAQDDLNTAPGAQEQSSWTVQLHHQTEPVVLDGVVPARHTAVAPPSSARCRARRGHQAARRERAAAAPTFFGFGRLYRASRQLVPSRASADDRKPRCSGPSTAAAPQLLAHRIDFAGICLAALQGGQADSLLIDPLLDSQCTGDAPA